MGAGSDEIDDDGLRVGPRFGVVLPWRCITGTVSVAKPSRAALDPSFQFLKASSTLQPSPRLYFLGVLLFTNCRSQCQYNPRSYGPSGALRAISTMLAFLNPASPVGFEQMYHFRTSFTSQLTLPTSLRRPWCAMLCQKGSHLKRKQEGTPVEHQIVSQRRDYCEI
jgi:hypothetical protein